MQIEPGHQIEHFTIIEKIGQGGQAAVWSAHDERLRRTVAIKTINLTPFMDGEGSSQSMGSGTAQASASQLTNPDRFREEAQIIASLEHPNILPIYSFGQEGDWLYIVMRYMPAGSLKDVIRKEPLSLQKALSIFEPLASALDLAHQNQIIHRDIKSANVLMDAHLHPYLADFGLSISKTVASSEPGVGTLSYMSPEQMMGDAIDHRSDLYAFGILMFECLTGYLPKVNDQPWNLMQTMQNAPLPVPQEIPEQVSAVLQRITAMSPDNRYNSAMACLEDFSDAVNQVLVASGVRRAVEPEPEITDPTVLAMLEAFDLFAKAQERWADGAGRFRFEAGDFKYVDSYYGDPATWDIALTDVAKRMMLRGALEHGYNLDHWWNEVEDIADRRAVALQTLTSDLAAARLRALARLMHVPDSDPPAIPIRVATVIDSEPDPAVKMTGLLVLEQRAKRSKMWRTVGYSEHIDDVLIRLAQDEANSNVAELAAKVCARLRSTRAMQQLSEQALAGKRIAFNALVNAREEVDAFPPEVPAAIRRDVFVALSIRQFFKRPMELVWRYVAAALACGLVIGGWAYFQFNDQNGLLFTQRVGTGLAAGVLYGLLTGLGVFAATELPYRLKAWKQLERSLFGWAVGSLLMWIAFTTYINFFQNFTPRWYYLLPTCAGLIIGFPFVSGLRRPASQRSLAGAIGAFVAIFVSWQVGQEPLFYIDGPLGYVLLVSAIMGAIMGIVTFLPEIIRAIRNLLGITSKPTGVVSEQDSA